MPLPADPEPPPPELPPEESSPLVSRFFAVAVNDDVPPLPHLNSIGTSWFSAIGVGVLELVDGYSRPSKKLPVGSHFIEAPTCRVQESSCRGGSLSLT